MAYKEGFQTGQIPLEEHRSMAAAQRRLMGFWFDEFQKSVYAAKRRQGFTLGLAHAKHRWWIVLNPPGVSSAE